MAVPTTEERIDAAERELAVKLPREFRMRLMARNGGDLSTAGDDWKVFPVYDPSARLTDLRTANHIVLQNRQARSLEGFPGGALAIASKGTGDFLVLLPGVMPGTLSPQVHIWNHETRSCSPVALSYED